MAGKRKIQDINCAYCWKLFHPQKRGWKYCSRACRDNARKNREVKQCPCCGNEFEFFPNAISPKKYCSKQCYDKMQKTLADKECIVCGKSFHPKRASAKYCSKECYNSDRCNSWVCPTCWKKFSVRSNRTKYCCRECAYKAFMNEDSICPICWKTFHAERWQIYCSKDCFWKAHSIFMKDKRDNASEEEKKIWVENFMGDSWDIKSKTNEKYWAYLKGLWFEDISFEHPIWWKFYDLKVWEILIELNPTYTHNSTYGPKFKNSIWTPKAPDYHYNKLKLARDNWYRCIMVRDWDNLTKIPYLIEENRQQLYARKCEVKQIAREECHNFFESYHLQGDTAKNKNNIYIWLYYNDELVECMSFWLPRYNKNYEREILRLCTHKDYRVVWWADKIFKHFLELTNANSVISYCDMSKFDWKVYEQLGFKLLKRNKPSKHWYNEKEIESRKHITDNLLRQRWYDQIFGESYGKGTNNDELMKQRGYVEIYDCGQATFIWTKS